MGNEELLGKIRIYINLLKRLIQSGGELLSSFNKAGVEIIHTTGIISVENFESHSKTVEIFDRLPRIAPRFKKNENTTPDIFDRGEMYYPGSYTAQLRRSGLEGQLRELMD